MKLGVVDNGVKRYSNPNFAAEKDSSSSCVIEKVRNQSSEVVDKGRIIIGTVSRKIYLNLV